MLLYSLFLDSVEEKDHFITLYKGYHRQLFGVAYSIVKEKYLAEDILEETYLKLTKYIQNIDKSTYPVLERYLNAHDISPELTLTEYLKNCSKNEVESCHKTWGYLCCILKSVICDESRKNHKITLLEELNTETIQFNNVEDQILHHERINDLSKCILQLPEEYRLVLQLQYYQGLRSQEIGQMLNKSADNIRHISKRAREKLKKMLEDGDFHDV